MREILDAVYGLLIAPEPNDPLDSVLAEEYRSSKDKYDEQARKNTESNANQSMDEAEKKYIPEIAEVVIPPHLKCHLTNKLFVDPVKTKYGFTYERKAIEKYLTRFRWDPLDTAKRPLRRTDLTKDKHIKKSVQDYRKEQIKESED
ncbi:uncharacterized protein LOC125788832 [Astyanax mexicanus]|uniref:uncharacterized protein LOC125788832 n=1 Tax=Astyanax mexicanus TaxID=7994 RepID=UPI0020CB4B6C|nr:uncharacterized protein LOC125788832 [Astyanax mexicanus]